MPARRAQARARVYRIIRRSHSARRCSPLTRNHLSSVFGHGDRGKMFDQKTLASITSTLKAGQYSLLLGAGISLDSTNSVGQKLPGGNQFRLDLCRLKGARESSTLQRVFSKLTSTEIEEYVVKRFQGCKPGPSLKYVPEFVWRRIIHSMSTTRLRLHMGHQTSFNAITFLTSKRTIPSRVIFLSCR